ncbi:MAG: hypothetical protein WDN45_14070 [Caulobacteraceae bacterium]
MAEDLADLLYGPVLADRACGECTVCCTPLIDTPELKKAEGERCPNCTRAGCGVYETRPGICRTYNCGWKRIASMPPETRPDRLGVMFSLERVAAPRNVFEHLFYVAVAVDDPRALEKPLVRDALAMLAEGLLPVWGVWRGTKTLVHPHPDFAEAIMNPAPHPDRALVKKGRDWLERYAPFIRLGGGDPTKLTYGP